MTSGEVRPVTDLSWDDVVLAATLPVLADFTAPWCPPCRALSPVLAALARANPGRLLVVEVLVDDCPVLVARYGIQALPSMLLVVNGLVVDSFEGAVPAAILHDELGRHIPDLSGPAEVGAESR